VPFGHVIFAFTNTHLGTMAKLVLLASLMAGAAAMELTPENWDEQTAGKTVLIKFQAPW